MKAYEVEMTGTCREVYWVRAESEEEAMRNWADGELIISEVLSVEPVSAEAIEED